MSIKASATVHVIGKDISVQVSSDQAATLLGYLRQHGFQAAPPSPHSAGIDHIQLRRGTDVGAIKSLLKRWG